MDFGIDEILLVVAAKEVFRQYIFRKLSAEEVVAELEPICRHMLKNEPATQEEKEAAEKIILEAETPCEDCRDIFLEEVRQAKTLGEIFGAIEEADSLDRCLYPEEHCPEVLLTDDDLLLYLLFPPSTLRSKSQKEKEDHQTTPQQGEQS